MFKMVSFSHISPPRDSTSASSEKNAKMMAVSRIVGAVGLALLLGGLCVLSKHLSVIHSISQQTIYGNLGGSIAGFGTILTIAAIYIRVIEIKAEIAKREKMGKETEVPKEPIEELAPHGTYGANDSLHITGPQTTPHTLDPFQEAVAIVSENRTERSGKEKVMDTIRSLDKSLGSVWEKITDSLQIESAEVTRNDDGKITIKVGITKPTSITITRKEHNCSINLKITPINGFLTIKIERDFFRNKTIQFGEGCTGIERIEVSNEFLKIYSCENPEIPLLFCNIPNEFSTDAISITTPQYN